MTQITLFRCDGCEEIIGAKSHISLHTGGDTGIARMPDTKANMGKSWKLMPVQGHYHFHDGLCLGKFFDDKLKVVTDIEQGIGERNGGGV